MLWPCLHRYLEFCVWCEPLRRHTTSCCHRRQSNRPAIVCERDDVLVQHTGCCVADERRVVVLSGRRSFLGRFRVKRYGADKTNAQWEREEKGKTGNKGNDNARRQAGGHHIALLWTVRPTHHTKCTPRIRREDTWKASVQRHTSERTVVLLQEGTSPRPGTKGTPRDMARRLWTARQRVPSHMQCTPSG